MGLDITAYEKATLRKPATITEMNGREEEFYDIDGTTILYDGEWRGDGLPDGLYAIEGERLCFRAGSYSSYNAWRDALARLVGSTARALQKDGQDAAVSFVELINFYDNEGFIGPKTSAKLAGDFADWQERCDAHVSSVYNPEQFREKYALWRRAFELAANEGVVKFH